MEINCAILNGSVNIKRSVRFLQQRTVQESGPKIENERLSLLQISALLWKKYRYWNNSHSFFNRYAFQLIYNFYNLRLTHADIIRNKNHIAAETFADITTNRTAKSKNSS